MFLISTPAWSSVFVKWSSSIVPPAQALGISDLVVSWNEGASPFVKQAHKQGYRVYIEVSLQQAPGAAEKGIELGLAGIILNVRQSERVGLENALQRLRSAHPKLRLLVLNPDGKQPQMRGSLVIRRHSVLEVSSPTAQPWIDTNLALVKMEQISHPGQNPLYTFSWEPSDSGLQRHTPATTDYALAVAEAGAFHADLILDVDDALQKALTEHDSKAWTLWNQVRSYAKFYPDPAELQLEAAANVAVVVDELDPGDEVMNLLARHNIPFKVLRPADLKSEDIEGFDVVLVFARPNRQVLERISDLATHGKTVVLVDAQGSYPWQNGQSVRVNEHAVSYDVGSGKVLEFSEPVTDPETFAQDVRRLVGKEHALMSLWNGLTTIAVPYGERRGNVKVLEFVNYAEEPLPVQVQVKGSFASIQYETPEHQCCESLVAVKNNGFTEFVIPELRIAGRVYLSVAPAHASDSTGVSSH
jgi:protein-tyrosine-phosphatase